VRQLDCFSGEEEGGVAELLGTSEEQGAAWNGETRQRPWRQLVYREKITGRRESGQGGKGKEGRLLLAVRLM
jgi:hypothetical protein